MKPKTTTGSAPRRAGITTAQALRADIEAGRHCSFLDVRIACDRWLLQRDPIYRRQHENRAAGSVSRSKPFAGY